MYMYIYDSHNPTSCASKGRVPDKALVFDGYLIITKDACHATQGEILIILQADIEI